MTTQAVSKDKSERSPEFPKTRWTLVLNVQGTEEDASRQAMSYLCQAYWYPIYAHVRRSGFKAQDAEDLTQSFFEALIRRDLFGRVQPDGGRLRSYLLKALNHFISTHSRDRNRLKRGGGIPLVSIDQESAESRYSREPKDMDDPGLLYERRWATALMEHVLSELENECQLNGKSDQFQVFRPMLTPSEQEQIPHRVLAEKLRVAEGTARVALFRIRQRYGELLRSAIADTVTSQDDIADEIAHLMKVFRSAPGS